MHDSADRPSYNVPLIVADMSAKGWLPTDLAAAAELSDMTISRFLNGQRQTPRTAKKIARALRKSLTRYLVSAAREVA